MSESQSQLQSQQNPILIPIHSSSSSSKIPEWAMLELNGDLLLPHEVPVDKESLELGSLQWNNTTAASPILICGTHELQGKVEVLKQPFVVLQRDEDECILQGVITYKLLFNRYPKTILS